MKQHEQRQLDSLIRSQDFILRNPDLVGPVATSEAARQIEQAIAELRGHVTAQGATALVAQGQTGRIREMAKNLVRTHLFPIAQFARATLKGVPEYATLAKGVRAKTPKRVVSHAYAAATAAAPYVGAMTAAGFPADFIEHLLAATHELNEAIIKREPLAAARVQSTAAIAKLVGLGRDGVRKIDAVLANRLASDAPALAAWKAASRVQSKVGSIRKSASMDSATIEPEAFTPAGCADRQSTVPVRMIFAAMK